MPDVFSRRKRSAVMRAIRSKDTGPELVVAKALRLLGQSYELHRMDLPGKPDIVLRGIPVAIQVRGCFWHGHSCLRGRAVGSNKQYWLPKIRGNRVRDRRNDAKLRRMGWSVNTVWECQVRKATGLALCVRLGKLTSAPARKTQMLSYGALDAAIRQLRVRRSKG